MSGQRNTGTKRIVCEDSHVAEDKFAYIPQDNRKGGRAVNCSHIGVADMEPFSYVGLANQQSYVSVSTPFSSLRSSLARDVGKLEGLSEICGKQNNFIMTAAKASYCQSSQLLPFRKRY